MSMILVKTRIVTLIIVAMSSLAPTVKAETPEHLFFDGIYEAALDLPRIHFLFKRQPDGPALDFEGYFELNYAFLDTGASGVLMSYETVLLMGLEVHPDAQFVDVGVGGNEYFGVSEPLYIGTAGFDSADPYDTSIYSLFGPWRF